MVANVCDHFGDDIVVLNVEGCDSIIGFRRFVAKSLKIVKRAASSEDDAMDTVIRRVKAEVRNIPQPRDYDLSDFRFEKAVQDTSETLLKLISELESDGEVSKKSLTLAQCIQQHINCTRNKTSLGLAVKLHHHHGSADLVRCLNDHGLVCSYDEVLRFRKSVADYISKNAYTLYQMMGLEAKLGPLFGWGDNFGDRVHTAPSRQHQSRQC